MLNNSWLKAYNKLNNSYKKKLVFRFGAEAGFFSEYNHMVFAMLYCLKHEIKFVLSSRNNKFSLDKGKGWQDFFLPFCDENNSIYHVKHNVRAYQYRKSRKQDIKTKIFKFFHSIDFFTQDLWDVIRSQNPDDLFTIPELGINNNLVESCQIIINNIWVYQPDIKIAVDNAMKLIQMPREYYGIHIRGGDKVTEHKLFLPQDYIAALENFTNDKNIFVATDNYINIDLLLKGNFGYNIFTICRQEAEGHLQSTFDAQRADIKKQALIDLFVDVDMLNQSVLFVGTYSSNVGMYIGMRKGVSQCYCLDFDNWRIW